MGESAQTRQSWIRRPGGPSAVVLLGVAALLSLWAVFVAVDTMRSPPPREHYGPFSDGQINIGFGVLILVLVGAGWWSATRTTEQGITAVLGLLVACGPIGWALAFVDSATLDLINSIGPAGAVAALLLLIFAPLVTTVAIVAAVVEFLSATWRRRRSRPVRADRQSNFERGSL